MLGLLYRLEASTVRWPKLKLELKILSSCHHWKIGATCRAWVRSPPPAQPVYNRWSRTRVSHAWAMSRRVCLTPCLFSRRRRAWLLQRTALVAARRPPERPQQLQAGNKKTATERWTDKTQIRRHWSCESSSRITELSHSKHLNLHNKRLELGFIKHFLYRLFLFFLRIY